MAERVYARIFLNCFRCDLPFDLPDVKRQKIYCPLCRGILEREAAEAWIKGEVERMEWPEVIDGL